MKLVSDDPGQMEETRRMMEVQAEQMVRLIDDLLDVSRITQGKLTLRRCRVALAEVVQNAVEASRPFIDEAGHQLTVTLPLQPVYLEAGPNRLAQVLSNLLNNSARYTPGQGHVWLSVEHAGGDVTIRVTERMGTSYTRS
jgi:signal transduction histidine kinase